MQEDLLASKNTLVEARDAVVALTEEISQKNCCLEFLKKKLQESEAQNNQAEQQCGSVTEIIQPRGVIMTLPLLPVINYFLMSFVNHILQCSLTCCDSLYFELLLFFHILCYALLCFISSQPQLA